MNGQIYLPWKDWSADQYLGSSEFSEVYRIVKNRFGKEIYAVLRIIKIPSDYTESKRLQNLGITMKVYYREILDELLKELSILESMRGMPNIAILDDFVVQESGKTDGWVVYIRMELLANMNNYQKTYQMNMEQTIKMGIDICSALECYHQQGIVYGKIKPSNIFISRYRKFKLGDFVTIPNLEKTRTSSAKEISLYQAPEILKGQSENFTTDIYSLGMVLYQILNKGVLPQKDKAMSDPLWGDRQIGDILRKACHADPKQRYQTVRELKEALQKVDIQRSNAVHQLQLDFTEQEPEEKQTGIFENYPGMFDEYLEECQKLRWYQRKKKRKR